MNLILIQYKKKLLNISIIVIYKFDMIRLIFFHNNITLPNTFIALIYNLILNKNKLLNISITATYKFDTKQK